MQFLVSQDTKFEKRQKTWNCLMVDLKQNNSGIGEVLDITLRFKVSLESWQMVEEFLTMFNWILKYLEYMLLYYVHLCTR